MTINLSLAFVLTILVLSNQALDFEYHNYKEMGHFLRRFADDHQTLVKLTTIGKSIQGRELWVAEVTATKPQQLGVPNVKLIGNIHGNEAVGREILLHFLEFLVNDYRENPRVRWLLDNTRIHILPSMNPDGFESSSEGLCTKGLGRSNARHVDLNRSFPDFFKKNDLNPQPETKAVMDWMKRVPFILSASLHGGALVANYPYENRKEPGSIMSYSAPSLSPDDDVFRYLALVYSKHHPYMHKGQPCPPSDKKFTDGITNGAAWYPITGGMQDYNYIAHGCMEITMEISCCKYPPAKELPSFWKDNKMALLEYISRAHQGVRGLVVDGIHHTVIQNASLQVIGRNITFRTTESGEFWRLLLPGPYQLHITSKGYENKTLNFTILNHNETDFELTTLNISMYPLGMAPTSTKGTTATSATTTVPTIPQTPTATTEFSDRKLLHTMVQNDIEETDEETEMVDPAAITSKASSLGTVLPIGSFIYMRFIYQSLFM